LGGVGHVAFRREASNTRGRFWLSALGSAASIIALLIVLLQIVATRTDISEQSMVWRFFLGAIALVGWGGITVLSCAHCQAVQSSDASLGVKAVKISVAFGLALLFVAACLDGFFAALYWSPWLRPIWRLWLYLSQT
jgi:hypothetical protein